MKKAKKVLYLALTYVLVGVLCIGGTIAYLTSQDEDVNVMTLGNVEIEQLEYERVVDENGNFKLTEDGKGYELQDYTQAKKLNPSYGTPADDTTLIYFDQLVNAEGTDAPIANLKGAQDKYVFVKNTGVNDAYVRTLIAYEVGAVQDAFGRLITAKTSDYYTAREIGLIEVDGNNYYLVEYTYVGSNERHAGGILPADEFTYNSLAQVYMNKEATNDDVKNIDGNGNKTYDILVVSQAVQVDNFPDAKTALEEGFYVVTTTQHPWVDGVKIPEIINKDAQVDELLDILDDGRDIVLDETMDLIYEAEEEIDVDAKGATVILNGTGASTGDYGYLGFVPAAGEDATVENLNVEGTGFIEVGHYGVGGGNYTVNNLTVKDFTSTLAVNDGQYKVSAAFAHYGNATLNDCVITGTKTVDASATAYDAGFVNKTNTIINGGEFGSMYVWGQAHVTINDAKVGTIDSGAITTRNYGMLTIGAGAEVDTINIVCADKYTPALTIETGAKVGKIVYKGVTYTQAEWLAR